MKINTIRDCFAALSYFTSILSIDPIMHQFVRVRIWRTLMAYVLGVERVYLVICVSLSPSLSTLTLPPPPPSSRLFLWYIPFKPWNEGAAEWKVKTSYLKLNILTGSLEER